MFGLAPLVILFPALGLLINLALARRLREPIPGIIASGAAALAFLAAGLQLAALFSQPEGARVTLAEWMHVGEFHAAWALQVDTLSVTMMLVVTGVGTLIHIYAIGYMRGDPRFTRFFVYLNLFLVMMLVLVSADNYLMLFAGWEGVGLCSYLLIGFWFDHPYGEGWKNSSAARKAFLVNRVGDFGFLLAIALIFWQFGSLEFKAVFADAGINLPAGEPALVAVTLLLFVGAAGKSAQIPLFIWLPDAMAGPTPVSALIHAATMVTAGVFLVVRSHGLFALAPFTQDVVTVVGAITALAAAGAALAQVDIKRVLAYSTISQLGFMVAAVGMGAYTAGMFHLITHAFFKALLFLGAGSVIHALGHGGDMRAMGGLRTRMPVTFWTFCIGALSLAGIPPLAAFFSKDEILAHAAAHQPLIYALLSAAAFLTALYIGRQAFSVFGGAPRSQAAQQASESPAVITGPLAILAGLCVLGGVINWPGLHPLADWLSHTTGEAEAGAFQPLVAGVALLLSAAGIGLAYLIYGRQPLAETDPLAARAGRLWDALYSAWGLDALAQRLIVGPFNAAGRWLARADFNAFRQLDGGAAHLARDSAALFERTQTGHLNWNLVGVIGGLVLVISLAVWIGGR